VFTGKRSAIAAALIVTLKTFPRSGCSRSRRCKINQIKVNRPTLRNVFIVFQTWERYWVSRATKSAKGGRKKIEKIAVKWLCEKGDEEKSRGVGLCQNAGVRERWRGKERAG